jgi:hypothetical protein
MELVLSQINRAEVRYGVAIHAIQYLIAIKSANLYPRDQNTDPDRATADGIIAEIRALEAARDSLPIDDIDAIEKAIQRYGTQARVAWETLNATPMQ